jgi:membrane protease subunit HflC
VKIISDPGLFWKIGGADGRLLRQAHPRSRHRAAEVTSDQAPVVDAFARYRIINPLLFYQSVRDERVMRSRLETHHQSSLRRVLGGSSFQDRCATSARR